MPKYIYEQEIRHYWKKILVEHRIGVYKDDFVIYSQEEHKIIANNIDCYICGLSSIDLPVIQINSCIDYLRDTERYKIKRFDKKRTSTNLWLSNISSMYGIAVCKGAFIFSCIYLGLDYRIKGDDFYLLVSLSFLPLGVSTEYVKCMNQYYTKLVNLYKPLLRLIEVNDNV